MLPDSQHKWAALQLREDALTEGHAVGRTALQRVYDIIRVKHEFEQNNNVKATAARIAELFQSSLKLSKHSEAIAPAMVECALTIGARILGNAKAMNVITWCEETYGLKSPWNSVYKFQEVISRGQTPESIDWCFASITDSVRMNYLDAGDVSVRNISDRGTKYLGGRALLKRSLRDYFVTDFLVGPEKPGEHWSSEVKAKMRSVLVDHDAARRYLTAYPDMPPNDLTWQAQWPLSATYAIDLFEAPANVGILCARRPESCNQ